MLASVPASTLNHIHPLSGIPSDSFKAGNALASPPSGGEEHKAVKEGHRYIARVASFSHARVASSTCGVTTSRTRAW